MMQTNITRKNSELYTLRNRFRRYEKRLILEGLRIAKRSGLDFKLEEVEEGFTDTTPIIELAKHECPSLYRKYQQVQERYFEEMARLRGMLKINGKNNNI